MVPLSAFQLNYSDALVRLVLKMTEPDRKKRFSDTEHIRAAIRRGRRTKAEKRTLRTVFAILAAGIVILAVAAGTVIRRGQGSISADDRAAIAAEEELLTQMNAEGEYEEAYQEGARYLNINTDFLEQVEGSHQSILEQVLDACMGMEDYAAAADYVEELLAIEVLADYEQTAAVICAYIGDYGRAQEYLTAAEEDGAGEAQIERTRAEIAAATGDYAGAVELYEKLYAAEGGTDTLRRLAILSLRAGLEGTSDEIESNGWLADAIGYYEILCADDMGTYADQMNLVTAYLGVGYTTQASALLQSMSVKYPDRYEIFLNLAILEYNAQMKKAVAQRDFTAVISNTNKAKKTL